MIEIAIRCTSLCKRFRSTQALNKASLTVARGRILGLLGPSGCGKTTLLRLIAGFETLDDGTIEISGRIVAAADRFVPPEKRRIGMVFQDYALFPHLNVAQNVAYGVREAADPRTRVDAGLTLAGLNGLESRMPYELSGGQQRIALARALAPGQELLLLDEPFSNLDAAQRRQVRADVRRILKSAITTAIFVTHDQEEALSIADEVAIMIDGRVVQQAEPETLYCDPATKEVACFVGDADFIPGEAVDGLIYCELGVFPSRLTGSVDLMLRPENVSLSRDQEGPHMVIDREFFGHDQLLTVQLASGRTIRSRTGLRANVSLGDRVRVEIHQHVKAFPRAEPADKRNQRMPSALPQKNDWPRELAGESFLQQRH